MIVALVAAAQAQIWVAPRRPGQSVFRNTRQEWKTVDLLEHEVVREREAGGIRLFWYEAEEATAERARAHLERAFRQLAEHFDYTPRRRFDYVLYGTYTEFLKTNLFPLQEGILGVTATRGLEMTLPYFGDHATFEHTSTHELAHEFSIQKVRDANRHTSTYRDPLDAMPLWFIEGLAEHAALGPLQGESAMRVRDLVTNPDLYTGHGLLGFWDDYPGYTLWTYAGGHARVTYLEETCGPGVVNRILDQSRDLVSDPVTLLGTPVSPFQRLVKKVCGGRDADAVAAGFDAWIKRDAFATWLDSAQTVADFQPLRPLYGVPLVLDASPKGDLLAVRAIGLDNGRTSLHVIDPRNPADQKRIVADTRVGVESLHPIDPRNFDLGSDRLAYAAESRGRDILHVQRLSVEAERETRAPLQPLTDGGTVDDDADGDGLPDPPPLPRPVGPVEPWWRIRVHRGPHTRVRVGREGVLAIGGVAVEPEGDRVAFVGLHEDGQRDLFLWTPDDRGGRLHGALRRLTTDVPAERDVTWGPEGLVYASDATPDGRHQLFRLDPDRDGGPVRLTSAARDHLQPTVLTDGTIVFSAYDDEDRSQLYALGRDGEVRLTDVPIGAFDPSPGPDGAVWTMLQDHGRPRPVRLAADAPRPTDGPADRAPTAAAGPPARFERIGLQDSVRYDPLAPRNWGVDGGFAALGAGPGGVFGQLYLSFSDRLRDRGMVVQANAYGRPELTDASLLFIDQHGRLTWGAGPFHALRFRLDRSLPASAPAFQSGERFYGGHGTVRLPLDRFVYLQADAGVGGVSYFLFDDTAVFLADPLRNGVTESLLDDWRAANFGPRLQLESGFRFGVDNTRFHPVTGPVAGVTLLLEAVGGVQPLDAQRYGSLRADAQGYVPIPHVSGGNVGVEASAATSGGGDYAIGYWLSSYDTLRAVLWADPDLLGRHYWFTSTEVQVPLDAVVRLAVASSVEGVLGLDFGAVGDDLGSLWDRRVLDVATGTNFVLGPLVLRLHFAHAIDTGAPLPDTPRPWVTNFSISWLGG